MSAAPSTMLLSQVDESPLIRKLLLASAYPSEKDSEAHKIRAREIVDAGVQVVVNIIEIEELKTFTPYQDIMLQHAKEANREIELISFPISNQYVHQENQCVLGFCLELCDRIKREQVVLVHCWGGHGRTGTIISIMLGILFNLNTQMDQVRIVLDEMHQKNNIDQKS